MPAWRNPYVYPENTRDDHVKYMLQQIEDHPGLTAAHLAKVNNLTIDSEIIALADELTVQLFKQEVMADFTEFVGQVFKDYDETYHVGTLQYDPNWLTFAATDYGFTNPNVWLLIQVGPWGEINVLAEVYQPNLTAEQFADEIIKRRTRDGVPLNPPGLRTFYPDPADPMSSRTLSDKLKISAAGGTGGELAIRINLIRQSLRVGRIDYAASALSESNADVWRPRLMIDRSCTGLRSDMLAYRYPEKKEDAETSRDRFELPMKKDDHGPEALGRFMVGYYGAGALTASAGSRVRKAKIGRHASNKRKERVAKTKPLSAMRPVKSGYPEWRDQELRDEY